MRIPEFFMVSPCGYLADWFEALKAPADWTDCTEMSDAELDDLMVRRMRATAERRRDEEAADRHDMMHADRDYADW